MNFTELKQAVIYAHKNSPLYQKVFDGIGTENLNSIEDFQNLPFSDKHTLREVYPLGLQAVPDEDVVRIHSSSGTTGNPVIIPYTKQDVEDWAEMFSWCYKTAGVHSSDRVQIMVGYGLWTAGAGFQRGCETLGATAVPTGPGNTEKQFQMMIDLKSTVICSTSSYALLIAEEAARRNVKDKLNLRIGIMGSERFGDLMRSRISSELGIEIFDIYGLTEIYGPGIAIDCSKHEGMHWRDDFMYFEIIDPVTGKNLPDGESGELVITTLKKQAAPLIRYRTHDITRIIPNKCSCGSPYPMIDRILGRTDDMIKVKGVNIYPGQIEDVLRDIDGATSEYQIHINHVQGKDVLTLIVESKSGYAGLAKTIIKVFKAKIGITIECECVPVGTLPRSEKKSKRVFDNRD
ncbi:MAG: phenylacetate--CoA ligase [Ruminococcus sp.]|jgi:phenylacetate-CoA ligase|nr:phenylacetate--CoA ligase [Ruminococcus sp.]